MGRSINDILNNMTPEDVNKLSNKELRELTSQLISAANKRVKRAKEAGRKGFTYSSKDEDFRFSIKGKSYNQVRKEFKKVYSFLKSPTSTAAGYNAAKKQFEEGFKERTGVDYSTLSKEQSDNYWEAIHKFRELYPNKQFKYNEKEALSIAQQGGSVDEIIKNLTETMNENYEALEAELQARDEQYDQFEFLDLDEVDNLPFN